MCETMLGEATVSPELRRTPALRAEAGPGCAELLKRVLSSQEPTAARSTNANTDLSPGQCARWEKQMENLLHAELHNGKRDFAN